MREARLVGAVIGVMMLSTMACVETRRHGSQQISRGIR